MASDTYHEPYDLLSPSTRDMHRGVTTLIEELEAIDWYQQRADACGDEELKAVILHNKNEEIEHAMMTLEWIRRKNPDLDTRLRTYVFAEGSIVGAEERQKEAANGGAPAQLASSGGADGGADGAPPRGVPGPPLRADRFGGLGIGSLKER